MLSSVDAQTLIRELGINAGLVSFLVVAFSLLSSGHSHPSKAVRAQRARWQWFFCGLLFGLGAVLAMQTPLRLGDGVIVDAKTVIMALAGAYLPAPAAALAALVTAAYRIGLGGAGMGPGVAVILGAAVVGLGWRRARRRRAQDLGLTGSMAWLLGMGVSIALLGLGLTLTLPADIRWSVLNRLAAPVLLIFPLATLVFGFLFEGVARLRERESALRRALQSLRQAASVFSNSKESIIITDAQWVVMDVNPAFCEMTGYSRDEILGTSLERLRSDRHPEAFYRAMAAQLAASGQWRGEWWRRRKNGDIYPERLSLDTVYEDDGRVRHRVAIASDLSEEHRHAEEMARMTHFDALTGLPNRRLLTDRLQQAMTQAERDGAEIAVAFMDLDGFKQVNELLGQQAGDQLLMTMAERLRRVLHSDDTVSRLGGDEFVLLLRSAKDRDGAISLLERVLQAVRDPVEIASRQVSVSASIGVTFYPLDRADADTLLRHADHAMYTAKEAGKNTYHLFDAERDLRAQARRETLSRIEAAIVDGEMELFYQPKVRLSTGAVVGLEALVRWRHPQRGLLAPGAFLPELEGSEVARHLDLWVLSRALDQLAAWMASGLALAVSVNMAVPTLMASDFLAQLQRRLDEHANVAPQLLEIELLETETMNDLSMVSYVIEELQNRGLRCAIDDFGTGYSSLTYLQRLPAQIIKIDQSFVREMLQDDKDRAIVQGVIGLASAFGREVVAEGVETDQHAAVLSAMGCDIIQGYGVARPMPAADVPDWVCSWTLPSGFLTRRLERV